MPQTFVTFGSAEFSLLMTLSATWIYLFIYLLTNKQQRDKSTSKCLLSSQAKTTLLWREAQKTEAAGRRVLSSAGKEKTYLLTDTVSLFQCKLKTHLFSTCFNDF